MFMVKFVNGQFSWASGPFQNHSIAERHFYLRLKSLNDKIGVQKFFAIKHFFLSGPNRKFHIDLTVGIAVRKQNLIKNVV